MGTVSSNSLSYGASHQTACSHNCKYVGQTIVHPHLTKVSLQPRKYRRWEASAQEDDLPFQFCSSLGFDFQLSLLNPFLLEAVTELRLPRRMWSLQGGDDGGYWENVVHGSWIRKKTCNRRTFPPNFDSLCMLSISCIVCMDTKLRTKIRECERQSVARRDWPLHCIGLPAVAPTKVLLISTMLAMHRCVCNCPWRHECSCAASGTRGSPVS